MHELIKSRDGWETRILRDDSDMGNKPYTVLLKTAVRLYAQQEHKELHGLLEILAKREEDFDNVEEALGYIGQYSAFFDAIAREYQSETNQLAGCAIVEMHKENEEYRAEVRLEEKVHNELIVVEADIVCQSDVFHPKPTQDLASLSDDLKVRGKEGLVWMAEFEGETCKARAAEFALELQKYFDKEYFSERF